MDSGGIWVLVGIGLGLVATIGLAFLVLRRRKLADTASEEMTADQWFTLGIVFMGAGVALMASLGLHMAFMVAIGAIYMGMGARMKRQNRS